MRRVAVFLANEFEDVVGAILTVFLVGVLFYNVILRYLFGQTMPASEELARMLFLWVVFITAAGAARTGGHYRVTAQLLLLPQNVRRYILLVADLFWIALNLVVVYYGVELVLSMFEFPYISPGLQWNYAYVFIIIPVSFLVMTIRVLGRRIEEFKNPDSEQPGLI